MKYGLRVIRGRGEGRRIGIPTLNFHPSPDISEPHGIYAGWVWIGSDKHPAVFHWGPVPAYGISEPSLEAHLLDATLSEPPAEASVELPLFLREIRHFPDIDSLAAQIRADILAAKAALSP